MTEKDRLVELQHDYDGIEEYDNPSPSWWNYLFYGAIVFSVWYMAYYFGKGMALKSYKTGEEGVAWSTVLYDVKVKKAEEAAAGAAASLPVGDELYTYLKTAGAAARGKGYFETNCVSCHSEGGQGLVGPNLVDEYWISGWEPEAIIESISSGFPEKGMVAWKPVIGAKKVLDLAAYVISIEGSEVPNPKEPQGDKKE